MKKKIVYALLICFLFSCIAKNSLKKDSYKGIILKVYNDVDNHNAFSFSVKTDRNIFIEVAEFFPNSWSYAEIGDSIIKEKDELSITIKKKNGDSKIFYYQ
jgi:hypothetical protein